MINNSQPLQDERPWGYFRQFIKNQPATVKIIVVKPNEQLSLQSHAQREEFWRVLSGSGFADIGIEHREIKAGDEIMIPLGAKHRLASGPDGLEVMEISLGEFDENDIVRYEDKYGRS
jgi:mannose-6-phosphate isomerase-like protein (cupin superfamily)